jgi:hypothetical protein
MDSEYIPTKSGRMSELQQQTSSLHGRFPAFKIRDLQYLDKAEIIYGVGDTAAPITADPADQVNLLLHPSGAPAPDWFFIAGVFRQ